MRPKVQDFRVRNQKEMNYVEFRLEGGEGKRPAEPARPPKGKGVQRNLMRSLTVEAPRHEAGFRMIFGPQNDALQMGYGAGNIDLPASPKVPIKNEARKRFFF